MLVRIGTRYVMLVRALICAGLVSVPAVGLGQADPAWLKSWHEAQGNRPNKFTSQSRIASPNEPGVPFVIRGEIVKPNGEPASGVVIHAYHRDSSGFDFGPNDDTYTTWRLQGWAQTDAAGHFEFQTIRPAPDHLGREGAHIHFTLESDEFGRQWAPTVYISDDPLISAAQRRRSAAMGDFAWVREVDIKDGVEVIDVRFKLDESADF
ncbi:MAG: hypothetical protein KJO95_01230 [Gammaproteobacteria bacterium]|nr:hypothetical protein [Gammaproteobacteria bacterium]